MATFADGKFDVDCSTVVEAGVSEIGEGKGGKHEEVRNGWDNGTTYLRR